MKRSVGKSAVTHSYKNKMEKGSNSDNVESLKEEGELSDEDEISTSTNKSLSRDGSRRMGASVSMSKYTRPRSDPPSSSSCHNNWARYKAENQRFNGKSNFIGQQQEHRPNLTKFLPSLMDIKTRPSKHFNPALPPRSSANTSRPYPQTFGGHTYNSPKNVSKATVVPSPSSRLWENRRLRTSKEDQEKKSDEDDFETLLKKYRDIQGQLADIRKEEESVNTGKEGSTDLQREGTGDSIEVTADSNKMKEKLMDHWTIEMVSSPSMSGGASPVIDLGSSSPVENKINITDHSKAPEEDDDEELDELELRRIALASAAEKMRLAEVEESSASDGHKAKGVKSESNTSRESQTTSNRQPAKPSPREPRNNIPGHKSKNSKVPSRFLRARTPALRQRKPQYPPPRRLPDVRRSDNRSYRAAAVADSRSRQSQNRNRSRASIPDVDQSDKNKETSTEKTREIQKILLLDDPEEQVARFLALVNKEDQSETKSKSSQQAVKQEVVEQNQDNYEEVEMEIDSDAETSDAVNPVEELFEPDFYSAMQPMYMSIQPMYEAYDPASAWSLPQPSFSVTSQPQILSQPMVDPSAGLCLSNGQLHPGYMGPKLPYLPSAHLTDFQPPLPPPPPVEPPPAPPPPPPCQPPLPASPSPPPLPTEPPPPPPPPQSEDAKSSKLISLEDHIQAVLRSISEASKHIPQPAIIPQIPERHAPVSSETKQDVSTSESCFSSSDSDLYMPKRDSEFTVKDYEVADTLSAKRRHVETENSTPTTAAQSRDRVCDLKVSVMPSKLSTASVQSEHQPEKVVATTEDVPQDDEEGEEEEALLRARLLQSLAARKKEKEKSEGVRQSYSSPNLSRSQSPNTSFPGGTKVPQSQRAHYPKIHLGNLPTQKPVVIRLGEDSSDEEGEKHLVSAPAVQKYLGGLDSFLKEARRSAEIKEETWVRSELKLQEAKRKEQLSTKLRFLESDLIKHNESITKDQGLLKVLVSRASKYLQNVKVSEQKVRLLTEQLAAAEKVVIANKEALEKAKKQARMIKDGLLKKKTDYEAMQRCLLEMGQELHGEEYKIGMGGATGRRVQSTNVPLAKAQQAKHVPKKYVPKNRQMKEIKITIDNTAKTGSTQPVKQKLTNEEIIREKARLQKLAKEYEKKIQQLKKAKPNRVETSSVKVISNHPKLESKMQETNTDDIHKSILKLEKIELGTGAIDLTDDSERESVKRRRSLMEMNPSTRPDLKLKSSITRRHSDEEKENNLEIKIPEGKVLLKLLKMQRARLDEQLKLMSQQSKGMIEDQEYTDLIIKHQQISKLAAYKGTVRLSPATTTVKSSGFVYSSPLLHFRSYRFSPYFRTKALKQLRSKSIAHKILPKKLFCRFDVQGTCNDDKCRGQHQGHYTLSDREILLDIVAYCPTLAGVQNGMPAKRISKLMGDYVDNLLKQNQGRLSVDEMCLLLISRVNDKSKHVPPHTMFYTSRLFRPKQVDKQLESHDLSFKDGRDEEFVWKAHGPVVGKTAENIVLEDDRRYFYTDAGCEVQDLESAVMTSPHHTELWLKLASKKMHKSNSPPEKCLNEALNVLARSLEKNKESSPLWLEYLRLYARHQEAADYSDLCQTALHYAASFDIWWLYLHSLASYTDRNEVSCEVIDYLCSLQSPGPMNPDISHHLLETMLYKVHLSVMAGQLQYAKNILQGFFVKSEGKPSCQSKLTVGDRSILWLCYIHLMSWHELPVQLWDPANQLSGKIIHKDKLILPWHKLTTPDFSADQQMALLEEAIKVCIGDVTTDMSALYDGMALYKNLMLLLQTQNKLEEVLTLCRDLLQRDQSLVDVWLTVANLYAGNGEAQATGQVFTDAMEVNPLSAKMFNFAANFEMAQNSDGALKILEICPQGFFVLEDRLDDPLSLYCVLLKQTLPLGFVVPELRAEISEDLLDKQRPYLWLNYCLFLELRKDFATVIEMFETALCALSNVRDVVRIWKGYLEFQYRQMSSHPEAETECQKFNHLFHRCLITLPVKLPLSHWPGEIIEDYSHVNRLIDLYLGCLFPENRLVTLDGLVTLMPNNVELILRSCVEFLKQGDYQRALGLCYPLLHDGSCNLQMWKLAMSLTIRQGNRLQTYKMFRQAVGRMPYELSLWKDFLIYEMTRGGGAKEQVRAIIQQCQMLGLNTGELIQLLQLT